MRTLRFNYGSGIDLSLAHRFEQAVDELLRIPKVKKAFIGIRNQLMDAQYKQDKKNAMESNYDSLSREESYHVYQQSWQNNVQYILMTIRILLGSNEPLITKVDQCFKKMLLLNDDLALNYHTINDILKLVTLIVNNAIKLNEQFPNIISDVGELKKNQKFITSAHAMLEVAAALHTKDAYNEIDVMSESVTSKNGAVILKSNNIENLKLIHPDLVDVVKIDLHEVLNQLGPTVTSTFLYILTRATESKRTDEIIMDVGEYFALTGKVRCKNNIDQFLSDMDVMQHATVNIEIRMREKNKKGEVKKIRAPLLAYHGHIERENKDKRYITSFVVKLGAWIDVIRHNVQEGEVLEFTPKSFQIDHRKTPQATIYGWMLEYSWRANAKNRVKSRVRTGNILLDWYWETLTINTILERSGEIEKVMNKVKKRGLFSQKRGYYHVFVKNMNEAASKHGFVWEWVERPTSKKEFFASKIRFTKYSDVELPDRGA